jgi:NADPH:quinone reductase-like Zn-dependent oxidoreductase
MQAAQTLELSGIDSVRIGERSVPEPGVGQVLVRVHGAGVGSWDVVFVDGSFPGVPTPFVPGQEVAGVIEAVGEQVDVRPGDRVYASLFPEGGGFAEMALASVERLAPMPERVSFVEAASLVIAGGTAHEALVDRARLGVGEVVLITAAAGGVGSAAVQIARAMGARPLGLASPDKHDYLRDLGAGDAFDYHAADWVQRLLAAVPGGVDVLLDAAGGQTTDQALAAVRDGGRVISVIPPFGALDLERGITGESFAAHVDRERLEALGLLIDAGKLHPQIETVMPLSAAADALRRVAGRHTRGKIALQIAQ